MYCDAVIITEFTTQLFLIQKVITGHSSLCGAHPSIKNLRLVRTSMSITMYEFQIESLLVLEWEDNLQVSFIVKHLY